VGLISKKLERKTPDRSFIIEGSMSETKTPEAIILEQEAQDYLYQSREAPNNSRRQKHKLYL
jgi:hypothetical protein